MLVLFIALIKCSVSVLSKVFLSYTQVLGLVFIQKLLFLFSFS